MFKSPKIKAEYILGEDDLKIYLPGFATEPDCGVDPVLASFKLEENDALPNDLTLNQLLEFDLATQSFLIKKNIDFSLLGQSITAKL